MPEKIAVVTDSTADIPLEQLEREDVSMVPLSIYFGEEEFLDGIDLQGGAFYDKLAASADFPTTSQPPPGKFLNLYQELQRDGFTHVVSLHISRKLSGTVQSAQVAAGMLPGLKVAVLDSKSASWGLGNLVLYARHLVREGARFDPLVAELERQIGRNAVFFAVNSLEALERGGRIGKARALIGKYLGIRPLMAVREGRGEIEVVEKVHSTRALVAEFARLAKEHVDQYGITFQTLLLEAVPSELSDELSRALRSAGLPGLQRVRIGGVIGTHLGPSALGVALC